MNSALLNVGATKEAVEAAKKAVIEIINARADQKTIQMALESFKSICEVRNVVVQNCNFMEGETRSGKK